MKTKLIILFVLAVTTMAVCASVGVSRADTRARVATDAELDALDQAVQKRFHDVIGFGMARISSDRQFIPETEEEKAAVQGLKHGGYQICLFLVGRGVLQDVPEQSRWMNKFGGASHTIAGPVFFKKNQTIRGLPAAIELWEPARQAFQSFANGEKRAGFQIRDWDVEARPVRADDEKCLRCHDRHAPPAANGTQPIWPSSGPDKIQLGDAVGMVLYAHKKKT